MDKYSPPANPERVTLEAVSEGTRVFSEGEYFSAARSDFSGGFLSAIVAFIAFEASYFAEIFRGGIQSIPQGQVMAAYSTGLGYFDTMRHIVLPQALRNMVPPIVTQCVIIFQDTSLAYVIGLKEFLRRTSLVDARELRSLELYLFAGFVYLVFCSIGTIASRRLEKRGFRR